MNQKTTVNTSGASGGIGISGLLTVIFVVLKLIGVEAMVGVPWWSFNPFQFSVFIAYTWIFWILTGFLTVLVVGAIVAALFSKYK